jgi:hypothetical protein
MSLPYVSGYFGTARERYSIKLRKEACEPRPWTNDRQLQQWRFCNVHREDDKTTVWFRNHIRDPLSKLADQETNYNWVSLRLLKIVRSTIAFRWFNRIESMEIIQDILLGKWDAAEVERRLEGINPIVTGAYIIKGCDGYPKLQGVLKCIEEAFPQLPPMVDRWLAEPSLETAWKDLKTINYLGGFMAYEVVSDLRWTPVLNEAPDIMTWCNAGPGCARGLSWVMDGKSGRFNTGPSHQREMLPIMQHILDLSRDTQYWPQDWPKWEMREVEHWSCEFDKYCRARTGESMKRKYR